MWVHSDPDLAHCPPPVYRRPLDDPEKGCHLGDAAWPRRPRPPTKRGAACEPGAQEGRHAICPDYSRSSRQLGTPVLAVAHDFRSRLLRRRNDAPVHATIRSRSIRHYFPCLAPSVRCHDRRRHAHKQDGPRPAPGLRSDARTPLGHQHGKLRQRRWLLSLQLQCRPRL